MSRYGTVDVPKIDDFGQLKYLHYSAADLLGRGMNPRPLFSERRLMERMRPDRLGAYLILRSVYFRLPGPLGRSRLVTAIWRSLRA